MEQNNCKRCLITDDGVMIRARDCWKSTVAKLHVRTVAYVANHTLPAQLQRSTKFNQDLVMIFRRTLRSPYVGANLSVVCDGAPYADG